MALKIKITRKDKFIEEKVVLTLLQDFINDSYSGKRLKKNGSRISPQTIKNYEYFQNVLIEFLKQTSFQFKIFISSNLTQSEKAKAGNYYKKFYKAFTNFLYNQKKYYDNYVGFLIKSLRSFFNYLKLERNIDVGDYHKKFYVPNEEIPIIVLTKDQLQYIISDEEFSEKIKVNGLEQIRDIFVFGCVVALRVSDLTSLTKKNLIIQNDNYYVKVKSQKTGTNTSIKLPPFAVEIILKYKNKYKTLLPPVSNFWINKQLKVMASHIPDNFEIVKTRERRGKQVVVYKDPKRRINYKLSDHITSHTMRRTAITNMLSLGMPEHMVRKISGHAANSKEFFRYVELAQSFIDEETDRVFDKMME